MKDENINKSIRGTYRFIIIICALLVVIAIGSIYFFATPKAELVEIKTNTDDPESIENGVHLRTGFIEAPGMQETITNCTTCHSA